MVQFYCLSVVMNIFAGLILVYGQDLIKKQKELPDESAIVSMDKSAKNVGAGAKGLSSRGVRFFIGIVSVLVGFVKLFSPYGRIMILGDLLPACTGLAGGVSMLLEFYSVTTTDEGFELNDRLRALFIDSRRYIGVLCFLAALLHFVLPRVVIL